MLNKDIKITIYFYIVAIFLCFVTLLYLRSLDLNRHLFKERFTVTAYCPGACCNGRWAGMTASGKTMEYYRQKGIRIAAVDPKVIPLGTVIVFQFKEYLCIDVGGKIKGNRIDIFLPTHEETVKFGIKKNQLVWRIP